MVCIRVKINKSPTLTISQEIKATYKNVMILNRNGNKKFIIFLKEKVHLKQLVVLDF